MPKNHPAEDQLIITRVAHRSHRHGDMPAGSTVRFISHDADKSSVLIKFQGSTRAVPEGTIFDADMNLVLA